MGNHLEHWDRVCNEHGALVEFLEWLERNKAIELGPQSDNCPFTLLDDFKPSNLADRFLEVDRRELERERRALLAAQRTTTPRH